MTIVEVENLEDLLVEAETHVECCEVKKFFCGAPFHEELATEVCQENTCQVCIDIVNAQTCGNFAPHIHCPFSGKACCTLEPI